MINYFRIAELLTPEFRKLLDVINKLESDLQYPNCEGYNDEKLYILAAQKEIELMIHK